MNPNGDFKTLGLSSEASWDEVKSAFRRLARTYHPDVAGPDGARKFAEITEAYMSLKDAISPGATPGPVRPPGYGTYRAYRAETTIAESGFKLFWKRLWAKFFPAREETAEEREDFYEFSPARARFVGSAISRAESQLANLLSRRGEMKERNRTSALICRLRSRHPAVVLLALQQISLREANDEIRSAVMDHFTRNIPTTEVLESLLALFSTSRMARNFTRVLAMHACHFSPSDAQIVLRWLKRQDADRECFTPFLNHSSNSVVAATLNGWALSFSLPETSDISNLLRSEDEAVLAALLRLLKREKAPAWSIPHITRISSDHLSPTVRVWASAIVRDRNLG